jgi:hypothetical protein
MGIVFISCHCFAEAVPFVFFGDKHCFCEAVAHVLITDN